MQGDESSEDRASASIYAGVAPEPRYAPSQPLATSFDPKRYEGHTPGHGGG